MSGRVFALRAGEDGVTVLEMLIVLLLLAVLVTISTPTFLGAQTYAIDNTAKESVFEVHNVAKQIWVENDNAYPTTDQLLLQLTPGEPVYRYRASLPATSYSIDPYEVSVNVDDPQMITLCARSQSNRVYCARWDEAGKLVVSQHGRGGLLASLGQLGSLLSGSEAEAAIGAPDHSKYTYYSYAVGLTAEQDAEAALPSRVLPETWFAGPNNTGKPTWDLNLIRSLSSSAPQVNLTSVPTQNTTANTANFTWTTATGGTVTSTTCTLDGTPFVCAANQAAVSNVSYGSHTFIVSVTGPGGSDSDSWSWTRTTPPVDVASFDGNGDYATSGGMAGYKPTGAFEVGAWVKLNALPASGYATVASEGCTESNASGCRTTRPGWGLMVDSAGQVRFQVSTNSSQGGNNIWRDETWRTGGDKYNCVGSEGGSSAPVPTGKWVYIEAAFDPNGRLRTYVNNKVQACSSLVGVSPLIGSNDPLYVGAQPDKFGNPSSYFNGSIAELRMTQGGAAAFVVNPGPATSPGHLYTPAENGRPATFLFNFEASGADQTGHLSSLVFYGDAGLASSG